MSYNRLKREKALSIQRHLVKEQKAHITAMAAMYPDYMEGEPRCDKSLAWLGELEGKVKQMEDRMGVKPVNPLKGSKRS